jgi:hypothetical protein
VVQSSRRWSDSKGRERELNGGKSGLRSGLNQEEGTDEGRRKGPVQVGFEEKGERDIEAENSS